MTPCAGEAALAAAAAARAAGAAARATGAVEAAASLIAAASAADAAAALLGKSHQSRRAARRRMPIMSPTSSAASTSSVDAPPAEKLHSLGNELPVKNTFIHFGTKGRDNGEHAKSDPEVKCPGPPRRDGRFDIYDKDDVNDAGTQTSRPVRASVATQVQQIFRRPRGARCNGRSTQCSSSGIEVRYAAAASGPDAAPSATCPSTVRPTPPAPWPAPSPVAPMPATVDASTSAATPRHQECSHDSLNPEMPTRCQFEDRTLQLDSISAILPASQLEQVESAPDVSVGPEALAAASAGSSSDLKPGPLQSFGGNGSASPSSPNRSIDEASRALADVMRDFPQLGEPAAALEALLGRAKIGTGEDREQYKHEDLDELDTEIKRADPLFGARISKVYDGTLLEGVVGDILKGKVSRMLLYEIRYADGGLEHMEASAVRGLTTCRP